MTKTPNPIASSGVTSEADWLPLIGKIIGVACGVGCSL